jgi:hypothetical protein
MRNAYPLQRIVFRKTEIIMTTNYETGDQSSTGITEKLKQDLGNKAREASRQFTGKGKEQAEALSSKAADALEDVEAAAEAQAEELERRGWSNLSEYIHDMANGIGGLAENLRHKSVDEVVRDASQLAQRNTGLFLLGSIAIGFGLSRFVKAAPGVGASDSRPSTDSGGSERYAGGSASYAYPAGESSTSVESLEGDDDKYRPYQTH